MFLPPSELTRLTDLLRHECTTQANLAHSVFYDEHAPRRKRRRTTQIDTNQVLFPFCGTFRGLLFYSWYVVHASIPA